MTSTQRAAVGEIRSLTGLRFVAASWVVAHHFWLFAPEGAWLLGHLDPLRPLLAAGWLGVDLFFLLSGFVLAHNYVAVLGGRLGVAAGLDFYRARLSRIWPTWLVVLTAVVAGTFCEGALTGQATSGPDAATMLRSVLLVQVWDQPHYSATGPVGPGWSLSAEWLAYLAFPLLALVLYRLRGRSPVALGSMALSVLLPFAAACVALGTHDWAWSWLLRLAGAFVAGALVALCVARVERDAGVRRAASRAVPAAALTVLALLWWADATGGGGAGAAVLVFPLLVGALALADGGPARLLATPLVVLGGRISFALYLVHMAVFETLWTLADVAPAPAGGALVQLAAPLAPLPAAWVLWRFVEEPARRWMRGRGRVRPPAAPEPHGTRTDAPMASVA